MAQLYIFAIALAFIMHQSLVLSNSAGVGIPCKTASGNYPKLGHQDRGDLQGYQDRIDAANDDQAKNVVIEERKEHMKKLSEEGYKMYWTMPPVHSNRYTVRAGDGDIAQDPKSYTPGEWINIYVRALDEGKQFTGLIMYAVDSAGNTVGDWEVDPSVPFRYGEDASGDTCVTHSNAEFKRYLNVFRFKAPAAGTGTIKFLALVKVGLAFPVLDGNFYFPNDAHLSLTEGSKKVQRWFQGEPSQSCDEVCAQRKMTCDFQTLNKTSTDRTTLVAAVTAYVPKCHGPLMLGCSASTPSGGEEGCFYHDPICGEKPPTPVVIRKDPCEGLTLFNQQIGDLDPNECVKWAYQRQNNGIGREVYNDMYNVGQLVKVCCGASRGQLKDQDAFNDNMKIVSACAPPGGFTASPTPAPPPPRQRAPISCSAKDDDARDGGRICACAGGPAGGPAGGENVNVGTRTSSASLAILVATVFAAGQGGYRFPTAWAVLSMAFSAEAHNWVSSPSRANNGFNAYQTAPCPPKGSRVHFQVAAGQLFPMEFATGHGTPARGGTYLTVLKAEDEPQMIKHTRALLDDYIDSAPKVDPPYMAEHKAHHVGSTAASTTTTDVSAELASSYGVGDTQANIRNFGQHWGNKPPRAAPIYPKTASATADDIRVKYKNPKYPWIISAHKFKLHEDKSEEADLVMMEIPVGSPTGQYVIQYSWNGYYDCTDVNVISETSIDFYGSPATEVQFDKLDHCLWNPSYEPYEVIGDCKEIKKGDSADACFNQCTANNGCYGVQVVPFKLPAEVSATGKKGMFQGRTSTMPARCNSLQNVADDSLVCFPIKQGRSVVGSTYNIAEDPYDSIFYGTCYIRGGAWNFKQPGPGAAVVEKKDVFRFGQECISCGAMRTNKQDGIVPFWDVTFGECEHCDRTLG